MSDGQWCGCESSVTLLEMLKGICGAYSGNRSMSAEECVSPWEKAKVLITRLEEVKHEKAE
jgi:hypothetical protein